MTDLDLQNLKERCKYAMANGYLVARANEYAEALGGPAADSGKDVTAEELLDLVEAALDGKKPAKKGEKKKAAKVEPKPEEPAKQDEPAKADSKPEEPAPKADEPAATPEDPFKDL